MYREHVGLLRATARVRYRIPPDDIEALVNDVFASLLERRPRIQDARAFLSARLAIAAAITGASDGTSRRYSPNMKTRATQRRRIASNNGRNTWK